MMHLDEDAVFKVAMVLISLFEMRHHCFALITHSTHNEGKPAVGSRRHREFRVADPARTRDDFVPGPQGEVYPTLRLYKNLGGALSMKHFLLLSS